MLKNIIEYQKDLFNTGMKTMEILQGGTETFINDYWVSGTPIAEFIPLNQIMSEYKKECKKYKEFIDEGFDKLSAIY